MIKPLQNQKTTTEFLHYAQSAVWGLWEKVHYVFSDGDRTQTTYIKQLMEIKQEAIALVDSLQKEAEANP